MPRLTKDIRPARRTRPLPVRPNPAWTEPERWAWAQIAAGKEANFHKRYREIDPHREEDWTEEEKARRGLRTLFLRDVLLKEPWRSAITNIGVRIIGAWFGEKVDLPNGDLNCELWLERCRFAAGLLLNDIRCPSSLSLEGTYLAQGLKLQRGRFAGNLFLNHGKFAAARLHGVQVGGQVGMVGAEFSGELAMDSAEIQGDFFLRQGKLSSARLHGVQVDGNLEMDGAKFSGKLAMDGAEIKDGLFLTQGKFSSARLPGVHVGGQVEMTGAEFSGELTMDGAEIQSSLFLKQGKFSSARLLGLQVGGNLEMDGAKFSGELSLEGAKVGGNVFLRETTFKRGDEDKDEADDGKARTILLGAAIAGSLNLGLKNDWGAGSDIFLVNARIGRLYFNQLDCWPLRIDLDGLTYDNLSYASPDKSIADRPIHQLRRWLRRQEPFSAQPYHQCAEVLRRSGQRGKADAVLHACHCREQQEAFRQGKTGRVLGMQILRTFIGFGRGWRFFVYPMLWALAFLFAGFLALQHYLPPKELAKLGRLDLWIYSLDNLIPLITMGRDICDGVDLPAKLKLILLAQKVAGFLMATLVLAGVTTVVRREMIK